MKFIGTFGVGTENRDYIQPIRAKNELEASRKMLEVHGKDWCGIYTPNEWEMIKDRFINKKELPIV